MYIGCLSILISIQTNTKLMTSPHNGNSITIHIASLHQITTCPHQLIYYNIRNNTTKIGALNLCFKYNFLCFTESTEYRIYVLTI
jgi:hypothetical protein